MKVSEWRNLPPWPLLTAIPCGGTICQTGRLRRGRTRNGDGRQRACRLQSRAHPGRPRQQRSGDGAQQGRSEDRGPDRGARQRRRSRASTSATRKGSRAFRRASTRSFISRRPTSFTRPPVWTTSRWSATASRAREQPSSPPPKTASARWSSPPRSSRCHLSARARRSRPKRTGGYNRAKVLGERTAWQLAEEHKVDLMTILPGVVLDPRSSGGPRRSTSSRA